MKKKLLFVLNDMNIGGTEKAFLNLVDEIPPEENDVTLLLLKKSGGFLDMVPEWVRVEEIPGYDEMKAEILDPPLPIVKKYLLSGKFLRGLALGLTHLFFKLTGNRVPYYRVVLRGMKKAEQYDTAIAYCGPFDFLSVYVLYCVKAARKVQWIHFDVSKFQFNTNTCKKMYRKFQQIYVVSEEARRELLKKLPEVEPICKTFLNVVSPKRCRELGAVGEGFTDGFSGKRIVTVGRLSAEKGQDIIPEVARKLRDAGVNFRWYLIGDGKLRKQIENMAAQYDLTEQIVLLGTQTNPYPFLKDADLYVQTSVHEGYCITLAEAKAFNLPIVSTDCAGAHEQLEGEENCFVVKREAQDIYLHIQKALNDSE